MVKICNKIIEFSFYALFVLTPWAFTSATSELFEMNKMWLVWALTIITAMSWLTKMILEKKFSFRRTPLDIPIGLFLLSQIISTIFSLDPHTSFWGYYSRFNGGLLSIFSYLLLFYAFLSNFQTNAIRMVKRSLLLSLTSGLAVALWGLPSHFGYDPTCLLFRGTLDVSCWTAAFLPKVRIFSTLGQPDWLAAYLAILIPITLAYIVENEKLRNWRIWAYLSLALLFYIDILYTQARSGILGVWLSLFFFAAAYYWLERKRLKFSLNFKTLKSPVSIFILGLLFFTFIIGPSISQLRPLTLAGVTGRIQTILAPKPSNKPAPVTTPAQSSQPAATPLIGGGTESGDIRLLVWEGAINAWKANPIFGTGVETFAFAYYKYKPAEQNLTSEWNFLYNKAHNEYLNYLATSGIVGLATYLSMIAAFFIFCVKYYLAKIKQGASEDKSLILNLGLLTSYVSILITNFFGFSVVVTNIYLFLIPAFIFILTQQPETKTAPIQTNKAARIESGVSIWQSTPIFLIILTGLVMLFTLFKFWQADIAFALGYNLDRAGQYQQAYPNLHKAVEIRGGEPVFKDELSLNDAIIATQLISQKSQDPNAKTQAINVASSLAQEAINTSNEVISQNQNNPVFWKTRTRLFFTLSQVDSRYLPRALDAIEKASLIAPNDANIWYNLGVLYGQNGNLDKGISTLEKTIVIRPIYHEAHFGLGLFYHQKALDKNGKVVDSALQQKALAQMQYILDHISPKDPEVLRTLADWAK